MTRLLFAMMVAVLVGGAATQAGAQTLCPDGSFVPGDSCILSFDGTHVIGGPVRFPRLHVAPAYIEGRSVAIVPLHRIHRHHRIVRVVRAVQRNRILDAPAGTPAIPIPPLGK
jgi:hypothetical protein